MARIIGAPCVILLTNGIPDVLYRSNSGHAHGRRSPYSSRGRALSAAATALRPLRQRGGVDLRHFGEGGALYAQPLAGDGTQVGAPSHARRAYGPAAPRGGRGLDAGRPDRAEPLRLRRPDVRRP